MKLYFKLILAVIYFLPFVCLRAIDINDASLYDQYETVFKNINSNKYNSLYDGLSDEYKKTIQYANQINNESNVNKIKIDLLNEFKKYIPIVIDDYSVEKNSASVTFLTHIPQDVLKKFYSPNSNTLYSGYGGEIYNIKYPFKETYHVTFFFVKQNGKWKLHQSNVTEKRYDEISLRSMHNYLNKISY
jgi:hypothetical protein